MSYRIVSLRMRELNVPLIDPFVIASGRMEATRALLVEATVCDLTTGKHAQGLGECAALPPITHEDQGDIFETLQRFVPRAVMADLGDGSADEILKFFDSDFGLRSTGNHPVARAGVEAAVLDAVTRLRGVAMFRALAGGEHAGDAQRRFHSDITIPIHAPAYMGKLAEGWRNKGFSCFKIKVGIHLEHDLEGIRAIRQRVPDARFRIDANGGYDARTALSFFERSTHEGAIIECFEQPCARDDLEGMILVTRELPVPVIADESVRNITDLETLARHRAAMGVNLKVVKMYGPILAARVGARARELGFSIMCGAMVETRLGITTAAHVCTAVGGVEFVDLDTAWLLREDPFSGGYIASGPDYEIPDQPGQAIVYTPNE
jgi:L-Ala-D/L-Glu epimerase